MSVMGRLFLVLCLFGFFSAKAHNITEILSKSPEYGQFNSYLSQTKLADEINSRQTITVLVFKDAAMSFLAANHPLAAIKNALSIHVLLDYFDALKLHQISGGTGLTTSLYQTTGNAPENLGFVNITDLKGGKVGFGSAAPGSPIDSTYTKEVKTIPYNISVLEINQPIIAPGVLDAPVPSASENITALLEKAGCKTFATLIMASGVFKAYQAAAEKGLTVFAPSDEAFKAANVPDLAKLTNANLVALLQYHALASYSPIGTLKATNEPISTLATNGAGKFDLTVATNGDEVTLKTGLDSSRIGSTVIDAMPLCIFTVDNVLLPAELFGKAPSPTLAPEPVKSPSPSLLPSPSKSPAPVVSAPSPAPVSARAPAPAPVSAKAPAPAPVSAKAPAPAPAPVSAKAPAPALETPEGAPAPFIESPDGAPAEGPGEAPHSTSDNGDVKAPALLKALFIVSVSVAISGFLS
ncbi:fasciclin-like arabinogalactan protein 8 [Diospyros lotus]|uniref:fasciclin-like arabinogalactan protein 8 n=1 Tax=Diospyros lotus TaxID=55363 RepID=UPI00225A5321|nr:fasciclin-like arabinogalactan protein 8 [Diospyros lotus]